MSLEDLKKDFYALRDPSIGEKRVLDKTARLEQDISYISYWNSLGKENNAVYPSQGLLFTPFDYLDVSSLQMLPQETTLETLRLRMFFLELFNHPYRMHYLFDTTKTGFIPPNKVKCPAIDNAMVAGLSLSVGDLGACVIGSGTPRVSRAERYAQGPFVKLGRQARSFFVGSASPDVWNSSAAIATMAASHCLSAIPRNGVMSDINRQADLAKEIFEVLESMERVILNGRSDRKKVAQYWKNNVAGALEASPKKALERARALYKAGVRSFRVYSPEPGTGLIDTLKVLRKEYDGDVEIFAGQVVNVDQARQAEKFGADGIYIGIGGGGRCITGVRSGSVIDWPGLLWQLRGEISIPVIVEGGASDHVAITLLLGASGISVSRIVSGGTLESPGGALFCADEKGRLFKPYGGEASARIKYLDGKVMPFDIPSFVEGETAKAYMTYVKHIRPTLTYNLHLLLEDAILAMVFRNVENLTDLYNLDPSPLRQATSSDQFQRNTH